jgi:phosphatidylserine decarboxylase
MIEPRIPVAREGYPFIAFATFLTLFTAVLGIDLLAWPLLLITIFVLAFFRDPERMTDAADNYLLSPADGKVIIIDEQFDDIFLQKKVIKVSIFMNVFNVHVNRIPTDGKVTEILYKPGEFYSADSVKAALHNERCCVKMITKNGSEIAFVQLAGLIARRIVNWLEPEDMVKRGNRYGLIRFGSRVDLYLPVDTEISVKIGQKVRAGQTPIASLQRY